MYSSLGLFGGVGGAFVGLVWVLTWTINSMLFGVLLWTLIQKFKKK